MYILISSKILYYLTIFFTNASSKQSEIILRHNRADKCEILVCFSRRRKFAISIGALTHWPEEEFSFRRRACRLCARNKIRRSSGAERGPIKFAKLKSNYSGL